MSTINLLAGKKVTRFLAVRLLNFRFLNSNYFKRKLGRKSSKFDRLLMKKGAKRRDFKRFKKWPTSLWRFMPM